MGSNVISDGANLAEFLFKFCEQFFGGFAKIFTGLFEGVVQMFNFADYVALIESYAENDGGIWAAGIIGMILVIALTVGAGIGIFFLVRRIVRFRRSSGNNSQLIEEVNALNREVMRLNLEKDKILSMKVSQIGLNPNEISTLTGEELETLSSSGEEAIGRFYKLGLVDKAMAEYVPPTYNTELSLPELCERFRNFCCSRLGLYYDIDIIRLFVASFASTRLIILQGISGTGKTSLPYAFGKFIQNDAYIASVQPSWRDRSELFGYFNEFTKKYNETELLRQMYEAGYRDDVFVTVLDEMNIARVEYYFAEMLSILEMPSRDDWIVDLVPSVYADDPVKLLDGKLKIPQNMWFVGTANNDDSTFAITDKVYDRAMPIDINTKGVKFDAPDTDPVRLDARDFEAKLNEAKETFRVAPDTLKLIELLDDYVIEHFRLAFGNRIVKQLKDFVPAYTGCGGREVDGIDYVLAKKVFRKFEMMNVAYIRDEFDGLIDYLGKLFGRDNMRECREYINRLKKLV